MEFKFTVKHNQDSKRAVDALIDEFGISSNMQKRIRLYGNLWINDIPARMIDIVHTGDRIVAHPDKDYSESIPIITNQISGIEVIFEDEHLIVLNKPADLVVHPTMSHPDNTLLDLISDKKLHPVTRLDRETTGALIIAKHPHSHYQIAKNHIRRIYWALTHGHWTKQQNTVNQPIKRFPNSIMVRVVDQTGKSAITNYRVLYSFKEQNLDWVEFALETGRTHQIRVHSLYCGHPLLGDGLYGISNYCEFDHQDNFNILRIDPNLNFLCFQENFNENNEYEINENIEYNCKQYKLIHTDSLKINPQRVAPEYQANFKSLITEKQLILDSLIKRQALHSRLIGFTHPITKKYLEFKAELPNDMMKLFENLE
ncbi:MAG TPA: RluA family pseudouridine synthase [Clostridiaceae bacterium]|nr:RluA family pseudouridine synthase [Clostridiaceae bacterium]